MLEKLKIIQQRFDEVSDLIIQPEIIADQKRYIQLNKEYKDLSALVTKMNSYEMLLSNVAEAEAMLKQETDAEILEMARMELEQAKENLPHLEEEIKLMLIPKDPEDAKNAVVGRLATIISKIIRGKNKTTFTPHMDDGDFVVVKNIEQAKFTGNKFKNKKYYRHTGHPGGIKETTPEKLHTNKPGEALKLAVKRMLPGGVLGKKQLTKLKIYSGSDHPHSAQNPKVVDLNKLNSKNLIRN